MTKRLAAAAVFGLAVLGTAPGAEAQGDASRETPPDLLSYVERFTGKSPANCGQALLSRPFSDEPAMQGAIDCSLAAARDGKPSFLFRQRQAIDSLNFEGLLGSADGVMYLLRYASSTCGGACHGRFEINRCDGPAILRNARGAAMGFGCSLLQPGVRAPDYSMRGAAADLLSYVGRFTGKEPLDCGQLLLSRPMTQVDEPAVQRAIDCGIESARNGKAFWFFRQQQGIDSIPLDGLLGATDGVIYRFNYDSAPCGSASSCYARFSISRCDAPTIMRNARGTVTGFACALRR